MKFDNQKKTVTLSIKEVNKIVQNLRVIDTSKRNKLSYATTQLTEKIDSAVKNYNKKIANITVDYAAKDEKGDFKTTANGQGYVIIPEKLKEYTEIIEKLTEETNIEIELYKCKDLTEVDKLPLPVIIALNGILFDFNLSDLETEQNDTTDNTTQSK